MRRIAGLILAAALAGCGQGGQDPSQGHADMAATEAAPRMEAATVAVDIEAKPAPAGEGGGAGGAPSDAPVGPVLLAYEYSAVLEAPVKAVEPLAKLHERACIQAGARVCQVLGLQVGRSGEDYVNATLQIRAEPTWLASFRAKLAGDAEGAGGRLRGEGMTSEDLTRAITDTEARLRAQRTLRDRLQQILRERPGKLGDLLETERELARVQGEIDAAESVLAVMRARVSMSILTLTYETKANPVASSAFAPLADAFNGFLGNVAGGLAALVTLVAVLLPWVLVGGPLAWLAWGWIGRWRGKKKPEPASQPAP